MDRTIRVTGRGKIYVKPDLIRLYITLDDTKDSYENALEESTIPIRISPIHQPLAVTAQTHKARLFLFAHQYLPIYH